MRPTGALRQWLGDWPSRNSTPTATSGPSDAEGSESNEGDRLSRFRPNRWQAEMAKTCKDCSDRVCSKGFGYIYIYII